MIEVFATAGGKCRLWVEGHAAPDADRDAVCAGVSALVQSLVLYAADRIGTVHLRYHLAPGQAFFSGYGVTEGFALVLRGLSAIAERHPQHLQIRSVLAVDDK